MGKHQKRARRKCDRHDLISRGNKRVEKLVWHFMRLGQRPDVVRADLVQVGMTAVIDTIDLPKSGRGDFPLLKQAVRSAKTAIIRYIEKLSGRSERFRRVALAAARSRRRTQVAEVDDSLWPARRGRTADPSSDDILAWDTPGWVYGLPVTSQSGSLVRRQALQVTLEISRLVPLGTGRRCNNCDDLDRPPRPGESRASFRARRQQVFPPGLHGWEIDSRKPKPCSRKIVLEIPGDDPFEHGGKKSRKRDKGAEDQEKSLFEEINKASGRVFSEGVPSWNGSLRYQTLGRLHAGGAFWKKPVPGGELYKTCNLSQSRDDDNLVRVPAFPFGRVPVAPLRALSWLEVRRIDGNPTSWRADGSRRLEPALGADFLPFGSTAQDWLYFADTADVSNPAYRSFDGRCLYYL